MPERRIAVPASLDSIPLLVGEAVSFCADRGLTAGVADEVSLVLEELLTNLATHGVQGAAGHTAEVALRHDAGRLTITFTDDGPPFDPCAQPLPDLEGELEDRPVGGLGIYLVRTLTDRMEYTRRGDRNRLVVQKNVGG